MQENVELLREFKARYAGLGCMYTDDDDDAFYLYTNVCE
jgi:hypothetical protein